MMNKRKDINEIFINDVSCDQARFVCGGGNCIIYSCWHPINITDATPYEYKTISSSGKKSCSNSCKALSAMCCDYEYEEEDFGL